MGTYLALEDYDSLFEAHIASERIIVNDVSCITEEEREAFNDKLRTKYTPSDVLSNIPRCNCDDLHGWANENIVCTNCGHPAVSKSGVSLDPVVWMRAPLKINAFINPRVWRMLCNLFDKSDFRVIQYLTDRMYRPPHPTALQAKVDALQIERGLNHFILKFEETMQKLYTILTDRASRIEFNDIMTLFHRQRRLFFPRHIHAPNHTLFVLEKTTSAHYHEKTMPDMLDAIRTLMGVDTPQSNLTEVRRESKTIRMIDAYSNAHHRWMTEVASSKPGVYRKQVFAARAEFCFRAVIVSITDVHDYRQVKVPWSILVTVLEYHVTNKLIRRGMTPNAIKEHLYVHAHRYSSLLDEIFTELINEEPGGLGIPITLGRNPSLKRGSIQQLFIGSFWKDPAIQSIALSTLVLRELNADFDGDQVNCSLPLDLYLKMRQAELAPHKNLLDVSNPRSFSQAAAIPKPVTATISEMIYHLEDAPPDPDKLIKMECLPELTD